MRNRNNSKGGNSSRPSAGGSQGGGGFFKRPKPETESRFSKPSVKKSSLKFSASTENKGQKARPSFDHERPREDRPGFDKPRFGKPGFDKPRFDKPDFKKYGSDRGGDNQRPFRREGDSAERGFKKDFGKKDFRSTGGDLRGGDLRGSDRKPFGDRPERTGSGSGDRNREFKPRFDRDNDEREFRPRPERDTREFKPGFDKPRSDRDGGNRDFKPGFDKPRSDRNNGEREFKPGFDKPRFERDNGDREFKPRSDRDDNQREFKPRGERSGPSRPGRSFDRNEGSFKKKEDSDDKPFRSRFQEDEQPQDRSGLERRVGRYETAPRYNLDSYEHKKKPSARHKDKEETDEIRLNRYIANAGICSRREADDLISSGQISVNGKIVNEMGYKVRPTDVVKYGKKALNPEKMVYILINKPKDYITTTDDPEERKTVLDLIAGACSERVYPVGRLDRNTTGLLLLTNDGELAEKLTHPSSGIKKIYQAELDKPITTEDFEQLQAGVELEDGFIRPDEVGLVTPDAQVVGLEIHSGRNRIVRRMFEHLGYEVQKLDRTVFAGLNKKDLPRGKWRFLTEKEVIKLKFLL
ncbi:23S rRNA pseudouridine2605 synthase [Dyadobacter sp. SG02]|uniref:pseudouridine synthase n=1 Tax=Dyadobacter sp. SG02 TaxID=1855291 RepID=UPI0008C17856|nr:pseudouridine synthase [Dyadobacter sp. SG02]SEI89745.1 23S rRNA pseudouridine2605 synthase [Dyadobacter sp. SG02]